MKEQTATFIGHSECFDLNKKILEDNIITLINQGVNEFISGGMGEFDWICAKIVFDLKSQYPCIQNTLVIPYLNFNIRNKELFDNIVYPNGFEKYYFKSAIVHRNKYLVDNSAYAICYVNHTWGGAYKTYEYALKKGVKIINIS